MLLADLLRETLDVDSQDIWENERTLTPVRRLGVCLHTAGLSVRGTTAILELLGVERSHGAVWQWTHQLADSEADPPPAQPARAAVDETAVQVGNEWYWLYAAVALGSLYLLDIEVFSRYGADPAAAFLHKLTDIYDVSDTDFLVDAYGYQVSLSRLGLSSRVERHDRNHIEK